jgi:hypothetical protein
LGLDVAFDRYWLRAWLLDAGPRQCNFGESLPKAMNVEKQSGETEVLIDHQSYAAGYRQAICDTIQPHYEESREFSIWPLVLSAVLMLAIIRFVEGEK